MLVLIVTSVCTRSNQRNIRVDLLVLVFVSSVDTTDSQGIIRVVVVKFLTFLFYRIFTLNRLVF